MRFFTLLLPLVLVLNSCGSAEEKTQAKAQDFEVLQKLDGRFLNQENVEIVTDKTALFKLYAKFNQLITPGLDQPEINFDKASILAIPYANQDKTTNSVDLDSITSTKNGLKVYFKESLNPDYPVNKNFQKKFLIVKVNGQPQEVEIKTLE